MRLPLIDPSGQPVAGAPSLAGYDPPPPPGALLRLHDGTGFRVLAPVLEHDRSGALLRGALIVEPASVPPAPQPKDDKR